MVSTEGRPASVGRMRDRDVRDALHARLAEEHRDRVGTRFVDELDLCRLARVDVAVINGTLCGYELKSDRDNLSRLENQVRYYSKVLDQSTLVVGERHYIHAVAALPSWWGVMVATTLAGSTVLQQEREALWNEQVDPLSLAQLLWREEALAELACRGLDRRVRSKPRMVLWRVLAEQVPVTELRAMVRHRLKIREGWRSR
jgi:hypothetical protein